MQILREYLWEKDSTASWQQPTIFGPVPSVTHRSSTFPTKVTTACIKFKTSGTMLRNLFPNKSYAFQAKDTVALASISVRSHHAVGWLGEHDLQQVLFEIHGVEYTTKDGSTVSGRYLPVLFEDSPDSISVGREAYGYPSVFSDVKVEYSPDKSYHAKLSWHGIDWASIRLEDLKARPASNGALNASPRPDAGVLVHKYVPATTETPTKNEVDADYDILITNSSARFTHTEAANGNGDAGQAGATLSKVSSNAAFEILPNDVIRLPTLHRIVSQLHELPVFEIVEATLEEESLDLSAKASRIS